MPIALITGANRGLGRTAALALAEAGVDLILTYRSDQGTTAEEARKLGRTVAVLPLQVGDLGGYGDFAASVRAALAENWGRDTFDHLVNNADVGIASSIADTTEEAFDELMNVHFKGVFFLTQTLLPLIADGGRIVNFSTGLARFTGQGVYAAYASMKGAVEVFTRYLAKEVGPRGMTVNVLAPGPTATDFGGGALRDDEQTRGILAGQTALGRVGDPDDIGAAVTMLLTSPGAAWITGQRIEASGGMLL